MFFSWASACRENSFECLKEIKSNEEVKPSCDYFLHFCLMNKMQARFTILGRILMAASLLIFHN
jgi:hypothetical protein